MKPRKRNSQLIKIGLIGILSLLLLYFGYNFLKGINLFESKAIYYVKLKNAKDVSISTPVLIDGYRVGLVREANYDYQNFTGTLVKMALDNNLKIPKGSFITVRGNPLTGAELAIVKSKNPVDFYANKDTLISKTNADLIAQVSDDIIPNLVKMISKIDSLISGLDKIINNKYIFSTFEQVNYASENINKSSERLRFMMTDQIPTIVSDVKKGSSSIAKFANKMDSVDIAATMRKLDETVANIQDMSNQFNSKDNSIGLLLHDKRLYMNLQQASKSVDSLLIDVRKNPARYVRFSLF